MTFSIDNPRGVATTPLGKYVWEKPSGEQGLIFICVQFGFSSTYTFWVVKHQSNTIFNYFVCNSMGSLPTGASPTGSSTTTIYILMHNFIISYRADFNLSLLKRAKKLSLIWYKTCFDMWSIFGVKLNYIVIFGKSCNSSTLLMELFMICDPLRYQKALNQTLQCNHHTCVRSDFEAIAQFPKFGPVVSRIIFLLTFPRSVFHFSVNAEPLSRFRQDLCCL